jgi:hypothetical protein
MDAAIRPKSLENRPSASFFTGRHGHPAGRILDHLRHQQLARDDQALRARGLTLQQKQRLRLDML